VNFLFRSAWNWLFVVVGLGFVAVFGYLLARWSWRWFFALVALLACVVFLVVLPYRYPATTFLDPDLPPLFLHHFWTWILVFVLGMLVSLIFLFRTLRAFRPAKAEAAPAELAGKFPDIDAAWEEILVHLRHAQIDPADQHVFLILAPHEDWTAALIRSSGLQLFAQAPETDAPIHAFATGDGVFLGASGASSFGTQGEDGTQRMEALCRQLLAQRPDCPVVRGVVVLFPMSWAGQAESVKWAAALRDDLRVLQRVLKVRCPVFALFGEMETSPGFNEFLARMPAALRQSRCGFAVPGTHTFSGDLAQRGLVWMSGWFHGWTLSLLSGDMLNQAGNNLLFCLDHDVRRSRRRLRAILESAFSSHRDAEPVLFRGCYFTATGAKPNEQAFSTGLLRGPRGRVVADHNATEWTRRAEEDDRYYRRLALGVGLGGGLLTLLAWVYIILVTQNPWWWAGLIAVVVAWIVAGVRIARL
jgi:type VI secretion system protein ImpL